MTGKAAVHLRDPANWASFPVPLQRGGTRGIVRRSLPLPPSPSPSEGSERSSRGSTTRTPPQLLPRCGIVSGPQFGGLLSAFPTVEEDPPMRVGS